MVRVFQISHLVPYFDGRAPKIGIFLGERQNVCLPIGRSGISRQDQSLSPGPTSCQPIMKRGVEVALQVAAGLITHGRGLVALAPTFDLFPPASPRRSGVNCFPRMSVKTPGIRPH